MNRSLFYLCILFVGIGGSFAQNEPEKLKMPGSDVQNLMPVEIMVTAQATCVRIRIRSDQKDLKLSGV